MRLNRMLILALIVLTGNIVCRTFSQCEETNALKNDGKYYVFERGIDDVGIIVENVTVTSIGSVSTPKQQTNHGRLENTLYKSTARHYGNIAAKTIRCHIVSASKLRTLYFIFALHRMRN